MKSKKFILALLFILVSARAGECLLAQEPAQVAIALMIQDEIKTLEKILDNQDKMLKRWDTSSSEYQEMSKRRNNLINTIKGLKEDLKKAKGLNHMTSNIESALSTRHPDWQANMTIDQVKQRQSERETAWKETVKAYMQSLKSAQDLHYNAWMNRAKLWEILKNAGGQTQAIQILGGFLEHANNLMILNEHAIQSFVTAYAEYERDEMDERRDFGKTTLEICASLKKHNPTAKKCKLGF